MLKLTKGVSRAIRGFGEAAYPNECCGVLLGEAEGNRRTATEVIPIDNSRESEEQYHRFVITPENFMQAELEARRRGKDVVGIYHSHPDHPAEPSDYDRENALPYYSYIIVAVEDGESGKLLSWELTNDREQFIKEDITWL
jgi:proteasome lid subunit RPN8/RPN11